MFDKFSDKARKSMAYAKDEAEKLNHDYIGTEHVLLGLLREQAGVAAHVLMEKFNVDHETVKKEVLKLVKPSPDVYTVGQLPFTPSSKKVIEFAIEEARANSHNYVGTEHLLLGLLKVDDGVAAHVLANLGLTNEAVRQEIVEFMNGAVAPSGMAGHTPSDDEEQQAQGPQRQQQKSKTPALDQFGRDMTALAKQGKLDPVIGRTNELTRIIHILARRRKNNPVLLGEAGVGKTAIVEGLAQKINSGDIPDILSGKRVVELDLALMVAGTKFRGQFEERLKAVVAEITKAKNIIVFIDELHTLVGAGNAEGSIDASNLLKPALARGEVQCIGATTLGEYRKYIEKDAALERRFQPVTVNQPSPDEAVEILRGLKKHYEAHHRVTFSEEAMKESVSLSERYITARYLPDKAIDVLDEAGAKVRLAKSVKPLELQELDGLSIKIEEAKEHAVAAEKFEFAAEFKERETKLKDSISKVRQTLNAPSSEILGEVNEEDVRQIVSLMTGVPLSAIATTDKLKLLQIESELHKKVVSQDEAVTIIGQAVRRSRAGLKDPKRPIASFLFLGPTGVGKTMLAKTLAEYLFGSPESMIRVDMSEYMEKHTVSRLIGAPPGYIGYDEAGQLTEKVRRRPYSLILLDEIEKAHPDIFNILLQVMEDGRLTDGQGRTVDFRNCILIMTSNVGSSVIVNAPSMGFGKKTDEADYEQMKSRLQDACKQEFKPEFLNRLDDIVTFKPLSKDDIFHIVGLEVEAVAKRAKAMEIHLTLTTEAREFLFEKGFDKAYGARPMRRAVEKYIENPLSEAIIRETINEGDEIELIVSAAKDKLEFKTIDKAAVEKKPRKKKPEAAQEETAGHKTEAK